MVAYFKRGSIAKQRKEAEARRNSEAGASPHGLPGGYYKVRETGDHWRVARWAPDFDRWEMGGGYIWKANYFLEIGEKVA